jgi:hypothetical protein
MYRYYIYIYIYSKFTHQKYSNLNIMCAHIIKIRNYGLHVCDIFSFLYNIIYLIAIVSYFFYTIYIGSTIL